MLEVAFGLQAKNSIFASSRETESDKVLPSLEIGLATHRIMIPVICTRRAENSAKVSQRRPESAKKLKQLGGNSMRKEETERESKHWEQVDGSKRTCKEVGRGGRKRA